LLSTGRSWRTATDRDLICFGLKQATLKTTVENGALKDIIEIYLSKDSKKNISVNKIPVKRLGDLYGLLHIIVFSPDDLALIKTGPMERRKFIDIELCQMNKIYYYNLKKYYHVLKQRNSLLKTSSDKNSIAVWDEQLVIYGSEIIKARRDFVEKIKNKAVDIHKDISKNKERLDIIYKPNVTEDLFLAKLAKTLDKDKDMGVTGTGIHKDDLLLYINNFDTRIYGSQGQQRSVCLTLKLSVTELIKNEQETTPVLLLDDVLSELDDMRQNYLLDKIEGIQTFITAAGKDILNKIKKADRVYYVENGNVSLTSC